MNFLKFKKVLTNLKSINLKNLVINFFIKGTRGFDSLIILQGKVGFHYKKTSRVNCKNGFFYINKSMRIKEPFAGAIELNENSEINVENTFSIHSGCHIILLDNAKLNLGSGYINRNLRIRCYKEISIGNNVAISENVTIWDSDAHVIIGKEDQMTQSIFIGNNVWIGNNVTILKGVTIGDGAIIAAGSLVNKNIPNNCLAAGVPAKVIRENVKWK
jgi:acetyltransferase-like isoleucine patch superfamily enzyme